MENLKRKIHNIIFMPWFLLKGLYYGIIALLKEMVERPMIAVLSFIIALAIAMLLK